MNRTMNNSEDGKTVIGYFVIRQKLPSLNDVVLANRKNKYVGSKMKKEIEQSIVLEIESARRARKTISPIEAPVEIFIEWHEKTKRRDGDNVQSSAKFILDALQKAGILRGDDRRYVKQVHHMIFDDKSDYVIVMICPADGEEEKRWKMNFWKRS